jgi:hypothetical protein
VCIPAISSLKSASSSVCEKRDNSSGDIPHPTNDGRLFRTRGAGSLKARAATSAGAGVGCISSATKLAFASSGHRLTASSHAAPRLATSNGSPVGYSPS